MISSNTSENKKYSDIPINRGINLILNGVEKPKKIVDLQLKFNLFKRKFQVKFSFDSKKL